jgi:hypothetical protein
MYIQATDQPVTAITHLEKTNLEITLYCSCGLLQDMGVSGDVHAIVSKV